MFEIVEHAEETCIWIQHQQVLEAAWFQGRGLYTLIHRRGEPSVLFIGDDPHSRARPNLFERAITRSVVDYEDGRGRSHFSQRIQTLANDCFRVVSDDYRRDSQK